MSKIVLRSVGVLIVAIGLHAQAASANTVVVGPASCQPSIKARYSTIQAGVDAVSDSGTVLVCPGTYPEQVRVIRPVTIRGVTDGNNGVSVITVPAGGLVTSVTTSNFGLIAAQFLVLNTANVNISNLVIDGTNSGCPTASGYDHVVGVALVNVGDVSWAPGTTAGTVRRFAVRNQTNVCNLAIGLAAENSYLTVDSNNFHFIDGPAVSVAGGDASVTNNTVLSTSNGIVLSGVGQSGVSANTISNAGALGIALRAGTTLVAVERNTIGPFVGFGIFIDGSSSNTVTANKATADFDGILLNNSGLNILRSNVLTNLGHSGIFDENSTGGNLASQNTINEAPFGFFVVAPGNDDLTGNTLVNVVTVTGP